MFIKWVTVVRFLFVSKFEITLSLSLQINRDLSIYPKSLPDFIAKFLTLQLQRIDLHHSGKIAGLRPQWIDNPAKTLNFILGSSNDEPDCIVSTWMCAYVM